MTRLLLLLVILAVAASRPPERPAPIPTASHGTGIEQGASRAPAVAPGTAALPGVVAMAPQPTNGTQPAWEGTPVTAIPSPGPALRGIASWYRVPGLTAAAGPALRRALGDWRGARVVVCAGECVAVTLTDWMKRDRLIDLSHAAFRVVCGPLTVGICRVRVMAIPDLPATDSQ